MRSEKEIRGRLDNKRAQDPKGVFEETWFRLGWIAALEWVLEDSEK